MKQVLQKTFGKVYWGLGGGAEGALERNFKTFIPLVKRFRMQLWPTENGWKESKSNQKPFLNPALKIYYNTLQNNIYNSFSQTQLILPTLHKKCYFYYGVKKYVFENVITFKLHLFALQTSFVSDSYAFHREIHRYIDRVGLKPL